MSDDLSLEEREIYMQQLMDNYRNPKNVGDMKDYTILQHQKNSTCGDAFDFYLKLDTDGERIVDVKFKGEGCAISTASMSLFSQKIIGMSVCDVKKLDKKDVFDMFGIKISYGKVNCALISLNALKESLKKLNEEKE